MNIKAILNTDMQTLAAWLRVGYAWWIDEIVQMIPARWQGSLRRRSGDIAYVDSQHVAVKTSDGRLAESSSKTSIRQLDVVLAPALVLARMVDLPVMSIGDVLKLVTFELDRLTPFTADNAFFDAEIVHRNERAGMQKVRIGVLPRQSAEHLMMLLASERLEPKSLRVAGPTEGSIGQLDFLKGVQAARGGWSPSRVARFLWIAVAVLFVANVWLLTVRDTMNLHALEDAVQSQVTTAELARRLRAKVDSETASRAELLEQRSQSSTLRILDAATQSLPRTAWVQQLVWNGTRLHLVGYAPSGIDVAAAMRASRLWRGATVRSATVGSAASGTMKPFDISIELKGQSTS